MQDAAVQVAQFSVTGDRVASVVGEDHRSPARSLRDAIEPIAMHHVWSAEVHHALASTGLAFFALYAWGRAAVLGDVDPAVAAAAFAVFDPQSVAAAVRAGQSAIGRTELLATVDRATIASLHHVLDPVLDPAELADLAARLGAAVDAADGTGRPLFCGVRALERPTDPLGALWRSCHALREHRGDSHVAVFVAEGLDPVSMNILTELWVGYPLGGYSASRRWSPARTNTALEGLRRDGLLDGDELSELGRTRRDQLEAATDVAQASMIEALGDALADTLEALERCSVACIDAGSFPADLRKRDAG